jgi:2-keto-4-pentenoate hydratase/2-oxohepta-3-ene-1,7-dioic acid hydratase in catechol pathway
MIHTEEFSSFLTLQPRDIISTSSPSALGPLADGDRVGLEIVGIGTL